MAEPVAADIRELIAETEGTDPGEIALSQIPGGASRETWLVEANDRRWVLRRDPPGSESLVPIGDEFELIRAAGEAGVPVATPLAFEPAGRRVGTAAMLMGYVQGTSVAPRVLRRPEYERARERLPNQLAAALAAIHSISGAELDSVLPISADDPALAQIDEWESQLDRIGEPLPAVELGLRWLRANAPPPVRGHLVHGDFRLGNFIVEEDGLAAVIDWELAHVGDPAEDIGWICIRSWRFGNDQLPVAGLGDLGTFLTAYERAGGEAPEPERIRFWEVLGNVKWAVICARQAHDHVSGARRSHELASLGRRICEPEWDLLELVS